MRVSDASTTYFDALTAGDAARLLTTIVEGDHFLKIGTDAGEVVSGSTSAPEYYQDHVSSTENFSIDTHRLDIEERSETAWFFTDQTWHVTWKGTPEVLAMRITGVLERQESTWKFAQIHASLGV